ncbi:MAG: hypothetical protein HFJ65_06110 [Eggerthellaceae bacterium]|nr:hypothetical protein [Eggerthellaceae bacterium]
MAQMKDMTPIAEGDVVLAKKEAQAARGILKSAKAFQDRGVGSGGDGERISLVTEERMQKKRERYEAARPVALEILEEARNALAVRFRFLDQALWKMPLIPSFDIYGIASDGRAVYFDPVYVIDRFKLSFNEVVRDVIHCLFHCIFRHPFMLYSVLRQPWDVACDIAIEAIILDLVAEEFPSNMDRRAKEALHVLKAHVGGVVTAERLYWFFGNEGNHTDLKSLAPMFFHDAHGLWYGDEEEHVRKDANGASEATEPSQGSEKTSQSAESEELDAIADEPVPVPLPEDATPEPDDGAEDEAQSMEGDNEQDASASDGDGDGSGSIDEPVSEPMSEEEREELRQEWEDIARRMEVDLETHLARAGEGAGNLIVALKAVSRDVGNYAEFLSRFATLHETMRVNDDEFDYIYYKYGLDHYGNMPLIEPLEYKDDKRIHDFVIAIDTSESCSGEVVQAFMNKTYNILRASESFTERVNIHIIQCDAEVQEDTRITSLEQLEMYMRDMELKGFGGTDFRPVFSYVDLLIEKGDITDLRGLLYFTDGEGVYPRRPPAYDTAFVFLDDGYTSPEVPPWALKTIVTKDELEVKEEGSWT